MTEQIPIAQRALGPDAQITLCLRALKSQALCNGDVSVANAVDAVAISEDTLQRSQRILGATHPRTKAIQDDVRLARECLAKVRAMPDGRAHFTVTYKKPVPTKDIGNLVPFRV